MHNPLVAGAIQEVIWDAHLGNLCAARGNLPEDNLNRDTPASKDRHSHDHEREIYRRKRNRLAYVFSAGFESRLTCQRQTRWTN